MTTLAKVLGVVVVFCLMCESEVCAQQVQAGNSKSWSFGGNVQLQYLWDTSIDQSSNRLNNGFFIRRGRLQVRGKLTDYVETNFQIEVRDNAPRLKDAEGIIKLPEGLHLRFGQFKVPVWREELRSSTRLLLVERSSASVILLLLNLSARQIGAEFGHARFAVNLSNGAGEGGREVAGISPDRLFVNNGKLITARINLLNGKSLQCGISGAVNWVGAKIDTSDNTGKISAVAPDFGIYLSTGANSNLDIEGGFAYGNNDSPILTSTVGPHFALFDVTGRWMTRLANPLIAAGGLDGYEFAAGLTYLNGNTDVADDERIDLRFGPAIYFGKHTRLQINGELLMPQAEGADSIFQLRSQANFVF